MAPQYRGGHRKTGNFIGVGFLAADVDAGMTLDEANDHPFVRHHAGLVHTTVSHTAERHRLRIIFLLDEPIQSARDWADAQLGIALKFNSDASVSDGARMFFGNTKAAIYHIGRTLPAAVVAGLIARGRDARAARKPGGGVLPVVSVRQIAGPELVKIAGGDMVRLDELGVGTRVHCPITMILIRVRSRSCQGHDRSACVAQRAGSRFGQVTNKTVTILGRSTGFLSNGSPASMKSIQRQPALIAFSHPRRASRGSRSGFCRRSPTSRALRW